MTRNIYRPEIDGLRAFAVIPVIMFHMDFKWIAGGYIGVDVFFVISGFLITSIIKKELEAGTFSFREFWGRRIRRILPVMIVVTGVALSVAYSSVFKPDIPVIGKQAMSALLSVANIYFWQSTGGYWGAKAEGSPFLHTWSLSVEEQFYLIFPIVLWLIFRFRPHWLPGSMLFVITTSLCLFLYGSSAHSTATFYLLPTRAWELATGCYLAVTLQRHHVKGPNSESMGLLALGGLCMLIASYLFVPTLNGGLAIAVLGAALIIAFAQSGFCNAVLTQRYIVHVGKLSYSLYMWHWPVLVFAAYVGFDSHKAMLLFPIYLLSLASYYFVERPTRRREGIIPSILVCYLLTLVFSALLIFLPTVYDTPDYEQPHWYGLFYDLNPGNELGEEFQRMIETIDTPKREASADSYLNGGIIVGEGDSSPKIVVLGDSHGVMWSDAIRSATQKLGIKTSFISMIGVSPFVQLPLSRKQEVRYLASEKKFAYDKSRMDLIEAWKPELVIVCVRWDAKRAAQTTDLLRFLEKHSVKVLLMEQPPVLENIGDRNTLQYIVFRGMKPEVGVKKYFPAGKVVAGNAGRELIWSLAVKHKNVDYIPVYDLFVKESQVLILDGRNIVYVDDDHLTTYGAQIAVPRIEQAISKAMGETQRR